MWACVGGSVIGPSHISKQMPNQDAYAHSVLEDGRSLVIAVSDGHGGVAHPLSDLGAKYAVESAVEEMALFFENKLGVKTLDVGWLKSYFETALSKRIHARWLTKIDDQNPIAYGCTLLMAVIIDDHILLLQLGDGKIAIVYDDETVYFPMMRDDRFLNNETTSLSEPEAWLEMQVQVVPNEASITKIALVTDGVENAYPDDFYDDAQFFRTVTDSDQHLMALLEKTATYSRDDATAVVAFRNGFYESTEANGEALVFISEVPIGVVPLVHRLRSASLPRRIHDAIRLIYMLEQRNRICPAFLTVKQIYLDLASEDLVVFPNVNQTMLSMESLCGLIYDITGIQIVAWTPKQLVGDLDERLKAMRYDYERAVYIEDQASHRISFQGANGSYELFFDSKIDLFQLMPLTGWQNHVVGKIVQHEKHPTIWGVQNLTTHTWQVAGKQILPGRVLPLQDGMCCVIFGIPIHFHIKKDHAF